MKFYPISSPLDAPYNHLKPEELPSILFERTINMEGLQREFAKVLLMPKKKKEKWLYKHRDMIETMLAQIKQEGQIVIKDMAMDEVTKGTIVDYMVGLKNILGTLEKVMNEIEHPVD